MKSSAAQIAANRANAQQSTGPRTDAGKARSSGNARKHGFTGARFYCPDSLQPLLEEIEASYRDTIQPQGLLEEDAFLQLRNARFNMERAQILMDDLGSQSAGDLDPLADPDLCKQYLLYQRYFNQAQSAFHRYLRLLRQFQTERALRAQASIDPDCPALASAAALRHAPPSQPQSESQPPPPAQPFVWDFIPPRPCAPPAANQTEPIAA